MIQRILIPIDFSPTAEAAAEYGCELATRLGAEVTLLNVYTAGVVALPDAVYAPTEEELRMLEHAARSQLLAAAYKLTIAGLHIDCATVEGTPAEAIAAWADKHPTDLIVMGTHGRHGIAHALLGSVAERVVRTARAPVLTVSRACPQQAHATATL